ncbi:hypothetical protein [Oricola thermophila]|uniref:Uncharacterized protein n=1 Tax=Oricola thermophila TaxID=2742145 RepID=A0A6N1VFX0_9HYPH|nr:hypothetical protein [Oricola thermophila]QKV18122.1 hypothetical protein HTY61_06460 [Oricola thermophila]
MIPTANDASDWRTCYPKAFSGNDLDDILVSMRILAFIAALVIFIVWDFAQNNAGATNYVVREVIRFMQSIGF